jgi:hypothetical protein
LTSDIKNCSIIDRRTPSQVAFGKRNAGLYPNLLLVRVPISRVRVTSLREWVRV